MTARHRRLAGAYLALADDPHPPRPQRSAARAAGALVAALALAVAAPLAWAAASPERPPADQPAATTPGKAVLAANDDDADAA